MIGRRAIICVALFLLSSIHAYTTASSIGFWRIGRERRKALQPIEIGSSTTSRSAINGAPEGPLAISFTKFRQFTSKNFFLVGMFVAVASAKVAPALGRNGGLLRPELFIGRYGVTLIFLLSGLSLELGQLTRALSNVRLNFLIQAFTFGAWPFLIARPLQSALTATKFFPSSLLDGLLIMMSLPTTVNMCVILTSTAGGNVASALCNAVLSNLAGIFLTPALLFHFFGSAIELPFLSMLAKLSNKVLLPVAVGQVLRATPAKDFYTRHAKFFKRWQEVILLSILWNAFCTAISTSLGLELKHGLALMALLPAVHALSLAVIYFAFSRLGFTRGEVVAAMFCASQKTLAFGLPLINTIFEGNVNLAAYCAPLMFIHPLQLMVGSALTPWLERYTAQNQMD